MIQPTLSFVRPSSPEKRVSELIAALDGKGWRHREDLARELGWSVRMVRAVASASEEFVTGNKGLCLFDQAAYEDVQHFIATMRASGRSQIARSMRAERRLHSGRTRCWRGDERTIYRVPN